MTNGSGVLSWSTPSGAGDMSQSTYDPNMDGVVENAAQLNNQPASYYLDASNIVSGTLPTAQVPNLDASKITTGTLAAARLPVGTAADKVAAGNDSRFTDARTPTGSAGGDLSGSYPNPTLKSSATDDTQRAVTRDHIKSLAVTTDKLDDGAVTNTKLADEAVTASKLANDAITSAHILNGSIVDADIASMAAISDSKLDTISTGGKVSGDAIISGTLAGTSTFSGSGGVNTTGPITTTSSPISGYGNFIVKAGGTATTELRFNARDNTNYVGFKSPDTLSTSKIWTLPTADGSSGQLLSTNGSGVLSWASVSTASSSETLTNKTINADNNTLSNIADAAIKSSANISRSKLAAGSVSQVVINDASGVMSSEAQLAISRGGTGASTESAALTNLLPTQTGQSGKVLGTNGSAAAWTTLNIANWDSAYTDRLNWDGGATGLNAATGRTSLALGTAATLNAGTSANNLVQLDAAAKLPAIDGSQLTGIVTTSTVDSAGAVMNSDFASNGLMTRTGAGTYSVITDSSSNWNTAYTDRLTWDGGSTGLNAATGRTSLGLGTAATLNTGTSANNLVQLDASSKLPAVDGSQLTNLPASSLTCPTGYIKVPADNKFTRKDFCVMKYEAKKDSTTGLAVATATGTPWVSLSWYEAKAACKQIGTHLITNGEWMTMARNIETTAINDIDANTGIQLATGHSKTTNTAAIAATTDPSLTSCNVNFSLANTTNNSSCALKTDTNAYSGTGNDYTQAYSSGGANKSQMRTHVLSNGQIIWDLAGNVWEWADAQCDTTNWYSTANWYEWNNANLTDWETKVAGPSNAITSSNGTGRYYACTAIGNALLRGGSGTGGANAGVFAAYWDGAPSSVASNVGFRCALSSAD